MKCQALLMQCQACGFEAGPEFEEVDILFTRGKRKGQVSHKETRATHNPQWARVLVERGFGFEVELPERGWGGGGTKGIDLFVCPVCSTVRAH